MGKHFIPAQPRGVLAVRADASGDPKLILAALKNAFEEFKAENNSQIEAIRKGQEDVVKTEKVDRINASLTTLQESLDAQATEIAAMKLGGGGTQTGPVDAEYTDAFRAHFRKGDVQANLNKGADAEGGYLAPVEWDRTITDRLIEVSPMRQIAMVQTIAGAGFKKLFNSRGTTSGWVGETAARPETDTPTFGSMTYAPGEIYSNPAATQQLLDDSAISLEQWLSNEVEAEFSYQEGLAFVAGDGVNKPAGFLTYAAGAANAAAHPWGAIPTATTPGGLVSNDLIDLVYSLPGQVSQGARFVMNRNTIAYVRKLKDGQGNYLWQPSFKEGEPQTILAYPVTEMAAMPDITTRSMPIAFGDFRRGYLIVDRTGVRVLRDPFSNKPYVHFYTTKRVGGGLLNPEVLRVLQMPAS